LKLNLDTSLPYNKRFSNLPGVKISWYGDTPMTSDKSECGFTAINDLVPYKVANVKNSMGYEIAKRYLVDMGY